MGEGRSSRGIRTLVATAMYLSLAGCATLPDDGAAATVMHIDSLRAVRYCEVFLIGGNGITKNLHAAFYNTSQLNNAADPANTCSGEMWAQVDEEAIKKEYKVLGVFKNGPRFWVNDWIQLPVGTERTFGVLRARWMGEVRLPKGFGKGSVAYVPTTVARKSEMGFQAGQPVFMLTDPDGMPWVMQAASMIVDSTLDYDGLQTLETKLHLPPGWTYQVKVLDQDLTIQAVNGHARIVQDDLQNTYDACFEDAGQQACSFQP